MSLGNSTRHGISEQLEISPDSPLAASLEDVEGGDANTTHCFYRGLRFGQPCELKANPSV